MARSKPSFFQRISGAVNPDDYQDEFDRDVPAHHHNHTGAHPQQHAQQNEYPDHAIAQQGDDGWLDDDATEGQLTVDVYQTPEEIVIRSIVAGVRPEDLDVSISRDMVTIRGSREEHKEVTEDNFFHKELYWGSFSRTILLPAEVEVEEAQALEKHGLLTIRLPKVNKEKQTKLKVKSS